MNTAEIGRAILVAHDTTATQKQLAAVARPLAEALLLAPANEKARILQAARDRVSRHIGLGRARDADRWRAIVTWLRDEV